jgi:hypothetical protein
MEVADTARDTNQGPCWRGVLRMGAPPAGSWYEIVDLTPATSNVIWSAAERQRFAARGRVSAAVATAASTTGSTSFNPDEVLDVSGDAFLALFFQNRTAVLRMSGMPLKKESEKEWKMLRAHATAAEAQGRKEGPVRVPHASVVLLLPVQSSLHPQRGSAQGS